MGVYDEINVPVAAADSLDPVALALPSLDVPAGSTVSPEARQVARAITARVAEIVGAARAEGKPMGDEAQAKALRDIAAVTLPGTGVSNDEAMAAVAEASNGLFGIERFLDDADVADIMINAHDAIFLERAGRLERITEPLLASKAEFELLIERIIRRCGNREGLNRGNPRFDARFTHPAPWGEVGVRVNAADASITVSGEPVLSLRKPTASGFDRLEPWTEGETAPLPADAAFLVREAFRRRASVLIVGGTGSGKTSLLKAMLRSTADLDERVIVVEEANELDLREDLADYVGLVANPAVASADIAGLIENAMRMRPDRVVVGECRKPDEVLSFLRAVNTGHAGSITTVHASSARDGLQAMLTLAASSSSKSSVEHVGSLIARGLDLVIYLGSQYRRGPDGIRRRARRVLEVCAVGDFAMRDGIPDFSIVPLYLRAEDRPHAVVEFDRPLIARGMGSLSDRGAHFTDRMRAAGVTEEQLRSWLTPRPSLPPVEKL
jgi:pilus assembly protein CpaF